jgi:hypothetical protein
MVTGFSLLRILIPPFGERERAEREQVLGR